MVRKILKPKIPMHSNLTIQFKEKNFLLLLNSLVEIYKEKMIFFFCRAASPIFVDTLQISLLSLVRHTPKFKKENASSTKFLVAHITRSRATTK
jgi:hypothetical protein